MEQISPTGPEDAIERDELHSTKDDLLQKITKVDREIAKAEAQISKLKKKQQELEDRQANSNKSGASDTNEEQEEERTKNQSTAQIVYADNRVCRHSLYLRRNLFAFSLIFFCQNFLSPRTETREVVSPVPGQVLSQVLTP